MDAPEENSVTQINKDKTLTARILSQSVCFSICYVHDKYLLWFYEFLINCCCFFLFWKIQDYSAMMSGNQKGIPLKVPSIPIKVLSPNTTQVCLF